MNWEPSHTKHGFSLVEVILSVALFSLVLGTFAGVYVYGREASVLAGKRNQATLLAQEGLEVVRNLRDEYFSNLVAGTYGLALVSGEWQLSGSSDSTNIFTRTITIADVDTKRRDVTSTVTWQQNAQRPGSVTLSTRLTNWRGDPFPPASCNPYAIEQGYSAGTCRQNSNQCKKYGETYLPTGDEFCTDGPSADTCCALP